MWEDKKQNLRKPNTKRKNKNPPMERTHKIHHDICATDPRI